MSLQRCALVVLGLLGACARTSTFGPVFGAPTGSAPLPGLDAIKEEDLKRDIFTLAGDGFRGREAGSLDELRASSWLADRAREAGLEPAGEDGTYFQYWSLERSRPASSNRIVVGATQLAIGSEAVVVSPVDAVIDAPLVFVGEGRPKDLAGLDLRGKAVVVQMSRPDRVPDDHVSLRQVRWAWTAIGERMADIESKSPAALVFVSDAVADSGWLFTSTWYARGSYGVAGFPARGATSSLPVLWMRQPALSLLQAPNQRLVASLHTERFTYPSVNVVAKVPGVDPKLKDEYVLFSGHQDHDGVKAAEAGDSIWNGADDNASVSVALLAIGRAFARHPGKRSALFVWHGAEEKGLLGSKWHANHPMVPLSSIVAVLNGDMIGRNHPDSAALLGVEPPHRNSKILVEMGLAANAMVGHFKLDTLWDKTTHPEGWYFRSDHLSYARVGVPAIYFSTLPHPDYHTPRDEPDRINLAKLTRVTQWMYATGWLVANAAERPGLDPGAKLER